MNIEGQLGEGESRGPRITDGEFGIPRKLNPEEEGDEDSQSDFFYGKPLIDSDFEKDAEDKQKEKKVAVKED